MNTKDSGSAPNTHFFPQSCVEHTLQQLISRGNYFKCLVFLNSQVLHTQDNRIPIATMIFNRAFYLFFHA